MKRNLILPFLIISFLAANTAFVNTTPGELTKSYSEEYDITPDGTTTISNRHGKTEIKTWSQNKVKIDVTVTVEGKNKEVTQRMLDAINVDFDHSGSKVSAETRIDNMRNWNNGNNTKMEINYIVYLPATNHLRVRHSHGRVSVDDMQTGVEIDMRHADLKAGNFNGDSKIDMAHGRGSIGNTGNLKLDLAHSELHAGQVGSSDINIAHSTFEASNAGNITSSSAHSHLLLGNIGGFTSNNSSHDQISILAAKSVRVNCQHSSVRIKEGADKVEARMHHGSFQSGLSSQFSEVDIQGEHTDFEFRISGNPKFKMEATSEHGGINVPDGMNVNYRVEDGARKTIKGYFGADTDEAMFKASLHHGNLRVGMH